jgi:hypothetical protein
VLKQDAQTCKIKEQYVADIVTDITLIFRVTTNGEARLTLVSDTLPFGNRDFQFNKDGELVGTGTGLSICVESNQG